MILFPVNLAALGSIPAVIDSYSESNYDTVGGTYGGEIAQRGEAITLAEAQTITSLKFYLAKFHSPTGNIVTKIYKTSGTVGTDAVPTGTAIATSNTLDISTLSTDFALSEFEFDSPILLPADDYALAIEYSGGDVSNRLSVGIDCSSPTYSGNIFNDVPGYSTDYACCFYLYGY